jgi:hypothetical protein
MTDPNFEDRRCHCRLQECIYGQVVLTRRRQGGHYALPPTSAFVLGGCIDSGRADAERR